MKLIDNRGITDPRVNLALEEHILRAAPGRRRLPPVLRERAVHHHRVKIYGDFMSRGDVADWETIPAARQLVGHGHVRVNGQRVDRAGCRVSPEDEVALPDRADVPFSVDETAIVEYYAR